MLHLRSEMVKSGQTLFIKGTGLITHAAFLANSQRLATPQSALVNNPQSFYLTFNQQQLLCNLGVDDNKDEEDVPDAQFLKPAPHAFEVYMLAKNGLIVPVTRLVTEQQNITKNDIVYGPLTPDDCFILRPVSTDEAYALNISTYQQAQDYAKRWRNPNSLISLGKS